MRCETVRRVGLQISVQDPVMMKSLLQRTFQRGRDKRDHNLMMASQSNRLTRVLRRPLEDVLGRPVMLDEIQIRRRKLFMSMAKVPHHGDGFQEDLR